MSDVWFLAWHHISDVCSPMSDVQCLMSFLQYLMCGILSLMSDVWHPISDVLCPMSYVLCQVVGSVYMTPGQLSPQSEFTPVPSHGSILVYMIPPQNAMLARVTPAWVHPSSCTVMRISLWYEISQRYHVNIEWPIVPVWNRSAGRLEQVACVMFAILNHMWILSTWSVPSNSKIWNGPVIM